MKFNHLLLIILLLWTAFASAESTENVFPGVADIIPMASRLSEQAATLTQESSEQRLKNFNTELESSKTRQDVLDRRVTELGEPTGWSFQRLLEVKGTTTQQKENLDNQLKAISKQMESLDSVRADWEKQSDYWRDWGKKLKKEGLEYPPEEFKRVATDCKAVLENISQELNKLMAVQQELSRMQEVNLKTLRQIDGAMKLLSKETFKKTARSLFSRDYYAQYSPELWQQLAAGWKLVTWIDPQFIGQNWWVILLQCSVVLTVLIGLRKYREFIENRLRWTFFTQHPLATGVLLSLAALSYSYSAPSVVWRFYMTSAALISACFLLSSLLAKPRMTILFSLLAAMYIVLLFSQAVGLPLPLLRLYLVSVCVAGIPLLSWYCYTNRRQQGPSWQRLALRAGTLLLIVSLVAQFGGYSTLSLRLVDAGVKTAFLLVMALFAYRLGDGGVYYLLDSSGFFKISYGSATQESDARARLLFLVKVIIAPITLLYTIQIWLRTESIAVTWKNLNGALFRLGEVDVSLSSLFSAVLVIYLAVTLSWLLRMLLDAKMIDPQFNQRGLRDSVKTLLHYMLMVLGTFFALGTLGIEMKNLAVIAGALSIGIGFGLQNIVNNFVSGLILLFERPAKLGDLIILDGEWAIVRKIGLRSTIIETFSNSEVIVPNSLLISEKLTNLTLSNEQARIQLAVGVAYGSDMDQVLDILVQVAKEHPKVLHDPSPLSQFVGFGNSSLDFELKMWIRSANEGLGVRSDIGKKVYQAFAAAGIEIPFPQQDLHVRSIAPSATEALASIARPCVPAQKDAS